MPSLPHTVPSGAPWQVTGHRHVAVCPSAERTHVLPKLQVTLVQGSLDPVGGSMESYATLLPMQEHTCTHKHAHMHILTTGPVAEQADAPLQDTLCTLQLAFVAIGGGI